MIVSIPVIKQSMTVFEFYDLSTKLFSHIKYNFGGKLYFLAANSHFWGESDFHKCIAFSIKLVKMQFSVFPYIIFVTSPVKLYHYHRSLNAFHIK